MIINNYEQLLFNLKDERDLNARKILLNALEEAVSSVDPRKLVLNHITLKGNILFIDNEKFDLSQFDKIYVIGGGKASGGMAEAIEAILKDNITSGMVNVPEELLKRYRTDKIALHPATHPLPSIEGMKGVEEMIRLVKISEKTLIICLISGGGSALMPLPKSTITLDDMLKTTDLLLKSGANIYELNAVRKHLSAIAGGQLAEIFYPSTIIGLIISDVIGDKLDTIASGPLAPDTTTYEKAYKIVKKYSLLDKLPSSVISLLEYGINGKIKETPKPGNKIFDHVHQHIIGNNKIAIDSAKKYLKSKKVRLYAQAKLSGNSLSVGFNLGHMANAMGKLTEKDGIARYIIAGGETTVKVKGNGKGGRNQHAAAAASLKLDVKGVVLAFMGTDGIDGPTDAAGAIADKNTVLMAGGKEIVLNYLNNYNTYQLFKSINGLILTGYTGTNVNDIFIAVSF